MSGTPLEIAGALKRTQKGNADWYYGGGAEAWNSLIDAYNGIPTEIRPGKHFAVWINGVKEEFAWNIQGEIANGDENPISGGGGDASIDDNNVSTETTYSSDKIETLLNNKVDKEAGKGLSEANYTQLEKDKVASLSQVFLGTFVSLQQLTDNKPVGEAGQFAYVGSSKYVWDVVNTEWVLSPDGIQDIHTSDVVLKLSPGKSYGKYVNGQTIPAAGKTAIEVQLDAWQETIPAVYAQPTTTLSIDQNSLTLEVGTSVNVTITNPFTQNDAGTLSSRSIRKDSVEIGNTSPYLDNGVIVSTVNKVYQAVINYNQGPIKNDNLGQPSPAGRIEAGQIVSNIVNLRGYFRSFWGSVSAQPSSSSDVRALESNRLENGVVSNTFTLNTGAINSKFVIVLAPGKSLSSVVDLDALNLNITSEYILVNNNMSVNDASGTPVSGFKMYVKTNSVPYTSNHRHSITIS